MDSAMDPSFVDARIDSRSITAENPTGARGAGGTAHGGRKGSPAYLLKPGEKVVLADIDGPGVIRHIYVFLLWAGPASMRALRFEVFYDGLDEPSVSVPMTDFFGLPHGRPAEFYSQLVTTPEARGLNSFIPMPFGRSVRMEFTNESPDLAVIEYQIDYTLEPLRPENGTYLHASFRRENPTTIGQDFVVADGFVGPGRFLGCSVGIRVLDTSTFYGEGAVKIYRDGDRELPTICGTSIEAYVGTGSGVGRHFGPYGGVPLYQLPPDADDDPLTSPDFMSFYRWHLADPVMFATDVRVTFQQIGQTPKFETEEESRRYEEERVPAGAGWWRDPESGKVAGIVERQDDVCATAFVYCQIPQSVPRLDVAAASADLDRLPYETLTPTELGNSPLSGFGD